MKSSLRLLGLFGFFMLASSVLAGARAFAAGEQVGRVRGIVTDTNGHALPGVVLTGTSPSLIGQPRTTMTDDRGRFELPDLPGGRYKIELSYEGTVPMVREVTVRQGETATLNVAYVLQEAGVSSVTVVEARSLTRPDSTHTGSTRDAATLNRLPTNRTYQGVAQYVPGVTGGANPNIKGGLAGQNRFLIDGMDVTDPVTGTFALNLTFDSIESVEILTGGADAEYNALGGVINVVPRGGGDDFHVLTSAYVNHNKLSDRVNLGPNLWEGVQPYNEAEPGPTQSYEFSINAGGPIIKRQLWYGVTFEYDFTEFSLAKGPPLGVAPYNIQHPVRRFNGFVARLRLDWAASDRNRFRLSGNMDPASIDNTSQSDSLLGVAETHQNQGGRFLQLRWDFLASDHLTFSLLTGYVNDSLEIGPQGRLGSIDFTGCDKFNPALNCNYDPNRPRRVNALDGTVWYQGPAYRTDKRNRIQFDPQISISGIAGGRHHAKVGLQGQYLWRNRQQQTPGGVVYEDASPTGALLEAGLCNPMTGIGCDRKREEDSYDIKETGYAAGIFLQDHWWTPLEWLTINPGVRFDYGVTFNTNNEKQTSLFGIGPRLGFAADVTRDGRNIIFGYYGRATDPMPLGVIADADQTVAGATRTYQWNPMLNMGAGAFESTPFLQSGGPGSVTISNSYKIPRTDEITAGARREFIPGTVTSVEYTWKRIAYDWSAIEVNRIWDPTGVRVVDYAQPDKYGQSIFVYQTPYSPRFYQGFIIASEGRPSPRWDYHVSHTMSWTTFQSTLDSNPRQNRFDQGWSGADLRHYTRLQAAYYLFRNLNIGAIFQYRSQGGNTATKLFYNRTLNNRSNQRTPAGTTPTSPNDIEQISEFRPPALTQLDVTVRYNLLPPSMQSRLSLYLDVFNVFNQRSVTAINATDTQFFGQAGGRQGPFRLQLGINYTY
jgi:hypothetical protein